MRFYNTWLFKKNLISVSPYKYKGVSNFWELNHRENNEFSIEIY